MLLHKVPQKSGPTGPDSSPVPSWFDRCETDTHYELPGHSKPHMTHLSFVF